MTTGRPGSLRICGSTSYDSLKQETHKVRPLARKVGRRQAVADVEIALVERP